MKTKGHAGGYNWDHNKPENQDGFINALIKKGFTVSEIEIEFSRRFKDHLNVAKRVRGHIKHLKDDHKDFPYDVTKEGEFVLKQKT